MTGRTSARSSAKRDQASSPPKGRAQNTRSTRSQSRELGGDSDTAETKRRGAKRGARAASEDSISSKASSASNASSRGGRTRKATRGAPANRDLSMVVEDREEEEEEDEDEDEEDQDTNKADRAQSSQRSQSPGVMSQMSGMSGTTAISAITSHSAAAVAELDPMMAEILPELLESSVRIMDLLAPADITDEKVDEVVRDLKTPGSRRSKKLRFEEDRFKLSRDNYGKDDYINSTYVLRRLLGDDPEEGGFRPDAILHAANLATLVKEFTVTPKESESMRSRLTILDTYFPEPFLYKFDDNLQYGSSTLLEEAFDLGLDIRTHWSIYNLYQSRAQDGITLEEVLAEDFFHPPEERNLGLAKYDDYVLNGHTKDILRSGPANSAEQRTRILERVNQIYGAFDNSVEAAEHDDVINFDMLEELFRWSDFLAKLVTWSRRRLTEISRSIREQGGIQTITQALIATMRSNDSQIEINYEPPPTIMRPRELLPPANITPGVPGKSLYDGKASVGFLKKFKSRGSSSLNGPPSNQKAVSGPSRTKDSRPKQNASERAEQIVDDYRPLDVEEDDFGASGKPRSTQEYVGTWNAWSNEKNKENRPLNENEKPQKRRLLDRQPNAERLHFDDSSQEAANQRELGRKRSNEEREASEESEDEGFEEDRREPDPARKIVAPVLSPKRRRVESTPLDVDDDDEARRSQEQLQADAKRADQRRRAAARERQRQAELEEDDEEDDDDLDRRHYTQVASTAKVNAQKATMPHRQPQKRTKWSLADEQQLIDLIERHGCSWALIQRMGRFEMDRDQVALKDKARNMKVTFLKARTELPLNFENVPLGAKELRTIRAVVPDYEG